ncbi:hypothetical protein ACFC1T_03875 [Kitasatospora sp. NPDC056076]|uniref:hypothetical protein n=1 Tax=Kitasatospora sp. NPDC056076 TaxID=3345703 RepID=UPI0035D82353
MDTYGVQLKMSGNKQEELATAGYTLAIFKAVGTTSAVTEKDSGAALWISKPDFGPDNPILWTVNYRGYYSTQSFGEGIEVTGKDNGPLGVGKKLTIEAVGQSQKLVPGDCKDKTKMEIHNDIGRRFTIGLSQANGTSSGADIVPICGFDAIERSYRYFKPIEQIVLLFLTGEQKVGTIFTEASTDGCLAVGAPGDKPTVVTYNDDGTWSGGDTVGPDDFLTACIQKV